MFLNIKNKGLGLIEIMISFMLLLFFVMAMNSLLIGRSKIYEKDKRTLIASNLCQKIIDIYKQKGSTINGYLSLSRTNSNSSNPQDIVNVISREPFNIKDIEQNYLNSFVARVRIYYGESTLDQNVNYSSTQILVKDNLEEIGLADDNNQITSVPVLIYQKPTVGPSGTVDGYKEMIYCDPQSNTSKKLIINSGSTLKKEYLANNSIVIGRDKMIVVNIYEASDIDFSKDILKQLLGTLENKNNNRKVYVPIITISTNISFPAS